MVASFDAARCAHGQRCRYGSDRWSCRSYCDPLLAAGYDVFTYEPRGQGQSDAVPGYEPLQWTTDYEVADARVAVVASGLYPQCGGMVLTTEGVA